jgi:hypothetical protein
VIHLLAHETQKQLQTKRFPIKVAYGPEAFTRESDTSLIVFHRVGAGETFPDATSPGRDPKNYSNRKIGFLVLVFAKSSKPSARREDHEVLCDVFVDALACAMVKAASTRRNGLSIDAGHLLTNAEREGAPFERYPGVVYELKCSLTQSVQDFDWDGNGARRGLISSVETDTFADPKHDPDPELDDEGQYAGTVTVSG